MWTRAFLSFSLLCALMVAGHDPAKAQSPDTLRAYRTSIGWRDHVMSGITYVKATETGLKGYCGNEFGVGFFAFEIVGKKARLVQVHPMLNRAAVRRTLRRDLRLLFVPGTRGRRVLVQKRGPEQDPESMSLSHQNIPLQMEMRKIPGQYPHKAESIDQ